VVQRHWTGCERSDVPRHGLLRECRNLRGDQHGDSTAQRNLGCRPKHIVHIGAFLLVGQTGLEPVTDGL